MGLRSGRSVLLLIQVVLIRGVVASVTPERVGTRRGRAQREKEAKPELNRATAAPVHFLNGS